MQTQIMVQLEDEAYTQLQAKARKSDELEIDLLRLQDENLRLREKLGLAVRRMFGPSSERRITGQEAILFNEAEAEAVPSAPEPTVQVAGYVRGKKKSGQRELQLGGLEIEEVVHELPVGQQVCPQCSGELHRMGEDERVEIKIIDRKS